MDAFLSMLPEPMRINGSFLYILFLFGFLFFLMKRFYVKLYAAVLEQREDTIEGAERKLNDVETLYLEKMSYIEAELKKARISANELRERLVVEARTERENLVSQARLSSQERKERTVEEVGQLMDQEKRAVSAYVDGLAEQITQQLLGRELS